MPGGGPHPAPPPPTTGDGDGGNAPPGLDLGDLVIPGLTTGGGDGDGGSSSSSSSSSSGGSSVPTDPTIGEAESFYYQLWGRRAPQGYVQSFLNGQTDLFDFIQFQLGRPGARKTRFYANALSGYAAQAAQIMGRR